MTALITLFMAPLAAQIAPAAPTTNAITDVLFEVSRWSVSIVVSTSPGATGARNSFNVP